MPKVLVIDDDPAIRATVKILLEHEGFDVTVVADGTDALNAVSALSAQAFDLMIVDIFMPGMDGLETIRELNRLAPGLPVIAMSGFSFRDSLLPAPDFLTMATKLGAACSLHKPFRPHELVHAVRSCLDAPSRQPAAPTIAQKRA
jgi:CheY-like chemotaxis protein